MAIFTTKFIDLADAGLNDNWFQKPGSASVLTNWRWDPRGGWETIGGFKPIMEPITDDGTNRWTGAPGAGGPAVGVIDSMAWFSRHNGAQQYLLFEENGNLDLWVGSGVEGWEILQTGRFTTDLPWQKTQYAAWANWIYIVNGVDQPIRWNGREFIRCGFGKLPPPPKAWGREQGFTWGVTTVDGLGLGEAGPASSAGALDKSYSIYRYAITFVNDLGIESPLSAQSDEVYWYLNNIASENGIKCFIAVQLPKGPTNTKARRLYRTRNYYSEPAGSGKTLYFCREIGNNEEDIWIDMIPDACLGSEVDSSQYGAWPRGAKYIAFFKSTCFLAGMPEYPDRVVWSRAGQPENFPPDNFYTVGDLDSGEITAIRSTKNALIVFKRRGIYLIRGDPVNGFNAYTLTEDVGCCSPNAFADLPGKGLMFVSEQGVYLLEGAHEGGEQVTQVRSMMLTIQDQWRDVNTNALVNACGAYYHRDREYWLAVPTWGSQKPDLVMVYHYETDSWSRRTGLPISCLVETRDHRGNLFFGSYSTTTSGGINNSGIHVWAQGWSNYNGAAVTKVYESAWMDFRRLYEEVNVVRVYLYVIGYDGTATMDYYVDRRIVATRVEASETVDSRAQQDPSKDYLTWGEGLWNDGGTFQKWRPIVLRFDVDHLNMTCREFKFQLTITGRGQILGYNVEISQGGQREVLPLNTLIAGTAP